MRLVASEVGLLARPLARIGVREDVLDPFVDAHCREDSARYRVVEALAYLAVVALGDERGVEPLHALPGRDIGGALLERVAYERQRDVHPVAVERETLGCVGVATVPVALLEAPLGAAGDLDEALPVAAESIAHDRRRVHLAGVALDHASDKFG